MIVAINVEGLKKALEGMRPGEKAIISQKTEAFILSGGLLTGRVFRNMLDWMSEYEIDLDGCLYTLIIPDRGTSMIQCGSNF